MAKKNIEEAEEAQSLTSTENFFDKNKKFLIYGGVGVFVIIIGIIGYIKLVSEPHELESQNEYWNAFYDFANLDTTGTAITGTDTYLGMEDVASKYNGTSGGNIANYVMAINYMDNAEYDAALDYLDDCEFEDVMVGTLIIGLRGDCYVELGDYEQAVSLFEEAAAREENEFTSPMFLKKAGLVYEELGDNESAVIAYQKIKDNWSESTTGTDIDKYLVRAQN